MTEASRRVQPEFTLRPHCVALAHRKGVGTDRQKALVDPYGATYFRSCIEAPGFDIA